MPDFTKLIAQMPAWTLWIVFGVFLFWFIGSRAAEGSEGFAKIVGPLGVYWRKRGQARATRSMSDIKQIAREVIDETHPQDYETLRQDLARVVERIINMQTQEDINSAYLIYDTTWHFEYDQLLAEHGVKTPGSRIAYRLFAAKYRKGFRLSDSGQWVPIDPLQDIDDGEALSEVHEAVRSNMTRSLALKDQVKDLSGELKSGRSQDVVAMLTLLTNSPDKDEVAQIIAQTGKAAREGSNEHGT